MATTLPVWSINADDIAKIEQAVPKKATAKPEKPRRVLIFSQTLKYHHASIPYADKAFELMGKATGAYTVDASSDPAVLAPENLAKYDALLLNNPTGDWLTTPSMRQGLLDFVNNGKGLMGIHAATDGNYAWPEFGQLIGGYFDGHPWRNTDTVTLKINQPDHPVTKAFAGQPLEINDEMYQMMDPYSPDAVLELVSLDTDKTDMTKKGIKRTDGDFPVSWVKNYGKGRVFYTSLGHNEHIYSNPVVLQHYLDGLQFALGDLKAPAEPAGKKPEKVAAAMATAEAADKPTTGTAATKPVSDSDLKAALAELDAYDFGKERGFLLTIDAAMRTSNDNKAQRTELVSALLEKALNDKLTYAARDLALRRLGEIGQPGTAEKLQPLLSAKDEKLAESALRAITDIPGKASDAALVKALGSTKGDTRVGIINALGQRRADLPAAVNELTKVAREGDISEVAAAVTALGKIGTPAAGQALLEKVRPPDAAREAWFAAMNTAADELAGSNKDVAGRLYDRVSQMGADSPARLAAFKGKAMLDGNPEAVALKALDDESAAGLEQVARQILVRGDNQAVAGQLMEHLQSASPEKKVVIVEILGARGDKNALDAITGLATHPTAGTPQLQVAAITALQHLGDQRSVPVLLKIAAEQKGQPADAAVESIVEMRVPEVDTELIRLINEASSPAEQVIAIDAAVARKSAGAVEPLLKAAASDNEKVAVAAFKALSQTAKPGDLDALLKIHDGLRKDKVIKEAGRTIASVARASDNKADAVKAVQAAFDSASDQATKISLLSVLGRIGGTMALKTLEENVASSDEKMKDAAIRALAEFPDATALEALMQIGTTDASEVHKVLAMRGVARLLSQDGGDPSARLDMARRALEIAPGAEEKKAVLGGVAELKTTGVLEFLLPFLDQADLKEETAAAILKQAPIAN
jgi:type 1 glutamine amidotransferase/HEAT repeat protein